jgi:plasmid replication initiation protein
MVSENPNETSLLPVRHPQQDLFICDIADCVLKNDIASMEHPVFSLSKKPDLSVREYVNGDKRLTVTPSVKGMATIYDKDILIFAISQLMAAKNRGGPISRELRLSARSFLVFANRHTGGGDYEQLEAALDRLTGTRLKTSIRTGGEKQESWFGLVESAYVKRVENFYGSEGRVQELRVTLSDWLFKAITANEVLSMHPDYFRLRKPIERRLYEIARKHCGQSASWEIGLELLYRKSGSRSPLKQFRHVLREISEADCVPQYGITLNKNADRTLVRFYAK